MFKITLRENGSLRLPKQIVGQLSLRAGDTLCCHMEDRILYITPEKEFDPTFSPPRWSRIFMRYVLGASPCTAAASR